jgi:hypothetical protein
MSQKIEIKQGQKRRRGETKGDKHQIKKGDKTMKR